MPTSYPGGRATLSRLELRCPPLPQTLMEAMHLIDQPDQLEVEPVTEMVQRDPIVVARLLHMVNSAYYGLRHPISSAERAVVMLGPVAVAGIVIGMNMLKLRSLLDGPAATCFQRLIRHSIATAYLTRFLLEDVLTGADAERGRTRGGLGFTAGLLHDFGKIILVYNLPEQAAAFYDDESGGPGIVGSDDREMEQLLFGCDHTEAGEYVARKLNFPDPLIDAIRLHHAPLPDIDRCAVPTLVQAVRGANLAAKALGYAFTDPDPWAIVGQDPVWDALGRSMPGTLPPEHLIDTLAGQHGDLAEYVDQMTASVDLDELRHRLSHRRSSIGT